MEPDQVAGRMRVVSREVEALHQEGGINRETSAGESREGGQRVKDLRAA